MRSDYVVVVKTLAENKRNLWSHKTWLFIGNLNWMPSQKISTLQHMILLSLCCLISLRDDQYFQSHRHLQIC